MWETAKRLLGTLTDDKRPQGMKALAGTEHGFRIDTGEYRVLFTVDTQGGTVTVVRVGHRRDVYRNL